MNISDKKTVGKTADAAPENVHRFSVKHIICAVLTFLFLLAVFSHDPDDLMVLEGGTAGYVTLKNLIGPAGAQVSRALFYTFGLATYVLALLVFLACARLFVKEPLKRRGYVVAVFCITLGASILLAMSPAKFIQQTDALGIGHALSSDLALSGGVFGSFLAAPAIYDGALELAPGLIRRCIGDVGTIVVALALVIPSVVLVFIQDWVSPLAGLLSGRVKISFSVKKKDDGDDVPEVRKDDGEKTVLPPDDDDGEDEKALNDAFTPAAAVQPEREVKPEDVPAVIADEDEDYVVAPPDDPKANRIPASSGSAYSSNAPSSSAFDDYGAEEKVSPAVPREVSGQPDENGDPISRQPEIRTYADQKRKHDAEHVSGGGKAQDYVCSDYVLPPVSLLDKKDNDGVQKVDESHTQKASQKLQSTLDSFKVEGHVSDIVVGPRVTRFEITLEQGVKVEKVTGIQNNIAMDLAAESIRILAPIPGKSTVGIEVPNEVSSVVYIRSLMESGVWRESRCRIPILLGRDIEGKVVTADLGKAPHLLIAGTTGSGKSVCMNTLIMSLLFKFPPSELRLILVDPKVVEFAMYTTLPHLITPVVNDPKKVPLALRWGVNEMERRYKVMAKVNAKDLATFNNRPKDDPPKLDDDDNVIPQKMPLLVIIVDELADIMMTEARKDVETSICRIAQKGRAAGIHLVIATQSPRKDVITGLIKANLPTKIAFKVGTNMDSRVILDMGGAEKLLGQGDMLFKGNNADGMERIQGSLVSDGEIQKVVDFISGQEEQHFDSQVVAEAAEVHDGSSADDDGGDGAVGGVSSEFVNSIAAKYLMPGDSDLMRQALEIILNEQKASTSYLQRRLGIGYNKSAELMDELEDRGIISAPLPGGQKREILVCDGLERRDEE